MRIRGGFIVAKLKYLLALLLVVCNCNPSFARFDSFLEFESFKNSSEYVDINDCNVTSVITKMLDDPLKILQSVLNPGGLVNMDTMKGSNTNPLGALNIPDCSGSAATNSELCDRRDYFVIDDNELNQTFLPDVVTYPGRAPTPRYVNGATIYKAAKSRLTATMFLASYASSMVGLGSGILVSVAIMGPEVLKIIDVCSNYYVVQPHEIASFARAYSASGSSVWGGGNSITQQGNDESYWNIQKCINPPSATPNPNGPNCVDGKYYNAGSKALTEVDVPYFYHCDPGFDPINPTMDISNCPPTSTDCPGWKVGRTWGYMGMYSKYCTDTTKYNAQKNLVGKIELQGYPYWTIVACQLSKLVSWMSSSLSLCAHRLDIHDHNRIIRDFNAGDIHNLAAGLTTAKFMAFYRYGDKKETAPTGQLVSSLKLCVATLDTFLPVIVGCTGVAPPGEDPVESPFSEIIDGTRCEYLKPSTIVRPDLASLGTYIGSAIPANSNSVTKQVRNFLIGDFHFASTVVGCVQDMIIKLFVPVTSTASNGNTTVVASPFQKVQANFRQIVMAALTLFVALAGINVLMSGEVPNRKLLVGYILKFAVVYLFALGDVWYSNTYGQPGGLIYAIFGMQNEFASWIGNTGSLYDYLNACTYPPYGVTEAAASGINTNIFSETSIDCSLFPDTCVPTTAYGVSNAVKMTIWDFVDCKIANYWNFGSCDFSGAGMLTAWWFSVMILLNINAFLFGLLTTVYFLLSLNIIVKFVHSVILSVLIIAILAFSAPIFVTFALFEQTKEICSGWIRLLMGYTLYPAMIMVFVMIFINTFDRVYYGFHGSNCSLQDKTYSVHPVTPTGIHIQASSANPVPYNPPPATCITSLDVSAIRQGACAGNNSIYCTFLTILNPGDISACDKDQGTVGAGFISQRPFSITQLFQITFPVSSFIPQWSQFLPVLELLFLTLLFYFLTESVMNFLAQLVNVQSLSNMASNLTGAIASLAKMVTNQTKMAKTIGKSIAGGGGDGAGDKKQRPK